MAANGRQLVVGVGAGCPVVEREQVQDGHVAGNHASATHRRANCCCNSVSPAVIIVSPVMT